MSEVIIYGASDDLVEVDGDACEEFGAFGGWRGDPWNGAVLGPKDEGFRVSLRRGAGWEITVKQLLNGAPLPEGWQLSLVPSDEFDARLALLVTAPVDLRVVDLRPPEPDDDEG